jgi:hypothetical protein
MGHWLYLQDPSWNVTELEGRIRLPTTNNAHAGIRIANGSAWATLSIDPFGNYGNNPTVALSTDGGSFIYPMAVSENHWYLVTLRFTESTVALSIDGTYIGAQSFSTQPQAFFNWIGFTKARPNGFYLDDVVVRGGGWSQEPYEILSATFDNSLYTTGEDAILTVTVKNNWASGGCTIAPVLSLPLTTSYSLSSQTVVLGPGSTMSVPFVWTVPSVAGQTSVDAQVTVDDATRMFSGATWITPVPRSVRDAAVEQAQQCPSTCGTCACYLQGLAMIEVVGMLPAYANAPLIECMARRYENDGSEGRTRQASAMRFVQALSFAGWASKSFGASMRVIGAGASRLLSNILIVPGAISTGIVCMSALTDWIYPLGKAAKTDLAYSHDGLPDGFVDSVGVVLDQVRDSADVACSDIAFVTGAFRVRVEVDSSYATADSSGLAGVTVFDMPDFNTRAAWIDNQAYRFGHEESDNPQSTAAVRFAADSTDSCRIALLHRGPDGGLRTLMYDPFLVQAGGFVMLSMSQDSLAPALWVDSDGDGIIDYPWYPTGVEEVPPVLKPGKDSVSLLGVPNPTGGETAVFLRSARGLRGVRVSVYDVAGREVRRLVVGDIAAGVQQVVWDGRADDGRPVASGIYHCVATHAGGSSRTMRLVILR